MTDKLNDADLNDLVMLARNGPMGRLNAAECTSVFRFMEDHGYTVTKAAPKPVEPIAEVKPEPVAKPFFTPAEPFTPEPIKPVELKSFDPHV